MMMTMGMGAVLVCRHWLTVIMILTDKVGDGLIVMIMVNKKLFSMI